MTVDEYFVIFTGGNDYIETWKPTALKDFAEAYHKMKLRELKQRDPKEPTKEEILEEMKRHNEDEAGIDNQWSYGDAEFYLLLSDKYNSK